MTSPAEYPPHGVPMTFTPPRRFETQVIPPADPPSEKCTHPHGFIASGGMRPRCPTCGAVYVRNRYA